MPVVLFLRLSSDTGASSRINGVRDDSYVLPHSMCDGNTTHLPKYRTPGELVLKPIARHTGSTQVTHVRCQAQNTISPTSHADVIEDPNFVAFIEVSMSHLRECTNEQTDFRQQNPHSAGN